jgi:CheY-like chemotaxis protein
MMKRLLLVEDQTKDARTAADVAESLGVENVEACKTVYGALSSLEKGLSGETSLPDGIVLDLDLGLESGFELLRYWHKTPRLSKIPLIVWSVTEEQSEVCQLFKVNSFVSKWQGIDAFRQALGELVSSQPAT